MRILIIFLTFLFLYNPIKPVFAQGISIIRDLETENFLYDLTKPIFKAAGLDANNVKIYIVNDDSLNAFVFGGQNVFINTGLITKYDHPNVLMGVIAHEAGHIAAGHLARGGEEMDKMGKAMILTYLAGIAAAISSEPDAGYAMIMGGNQIVSRLALKYNRTQEESADRLALEYLNKINYPATGLLKLLKFFKSKEIGYKELIDEYALTHPVSKKRINYIKSNLNQLSSNNAENRTQKLKKRMARIIVKLEAFLKDPEDILKFYDQQDSLSKYARCIAYFKQGKIQKSLDIVNDLIDQNIKDGYLWELKGQILFESGFAKEAVIAYQKATKLQKQNPSLAKIALASSIISLDSKDKELINFAINNLLDTLPKEQDNPNLFKQLSKAYDQNNDKGNAYLALAELNLLRNDNDKVFKYAHLAKKHLKKSDKSALIKADDILEMIGNDYESDKNEE